MQKSDLRKLNLPDVPGVYLFKQGRKVLYVGKATSLRDRVVDMVTKADRVSYEPTPTVLEALVREAALIKKYCPSANVDGKDDKTFLYAVITKEAIPRVLAVRGKDIDFQSKTYNLQTTIYKLKSIYGPFPSGAQLREGLRLIRRIFPFFDMSKPLGAKSKHQAAKIEFNTQIKQYPRSYDAREYARTIRRVMLFLSGRGKELRTMLEREMRQAAKDERFEDAAEARRELFALNHIQDVSLIKDEDGYQKNVPVGTKLGYRIEAYDTAHLSGTNAIGVMTVVVDGAPVKKEYRTFRIRGVQKNDDVASLTEILSRRLKHPEWPFPQVVIVDGGVAQKRAAERVLSKEGIAITVAAVVKDERHRPREVIGARRAGISEVDAVLANSEAHRFSLSRHRMARSREMHSK